MIGINSRPTAPLLLTFFAGLTALLAYLSIESQPSVQTALLFFFIPPVLYLCLKYPEVSFALFLASGSYKTDQRLQQINSVLDISLILAAVTTLSVLARFYKNREPLRFTKEASAPILLILLIAAISLMYTPMLIYGGNKLVKLFFITAPCFFLSAAIFNKEEGLALFFNMLIVVAVLMLLDLYFSGISPGVHRSYSALGANYIAFGRLAGFSAITMIFYFFWQYRSFAGKAACFIIGSIMALAMLLTGGRGPIVGLLLGLASSFAAQRYRAVHAKQLAVNLAPLILIFFVVAITALLSNQEYFVGILERSSALYRLEDTSTVTRIDYYTKAFEIMGSFPEFFTGSGLGGFGAYYNLEDSARVLYPHNVFFELGAELGIFALLAFIAFLYSVFRASLANIKAAASKIDYSISITLFVGLVYWLANAMFSGDINDNRFLFVVSGVICGMYERSKTLKEKELAKNAEQR